jgi:hypothetical protein
MARRRVDRRPERVVDLRDRPRWAVVDELFVIVPSTFQVDAVGAEAVPATDSSRVAVEADVLVTVIRT